MSYYKIWMHLFRADCLELPTTIPNKCINTAFWVACNLAVFGYIMPQQFKSGEMGAFMWAGCVATAGFFEVYPRVAMLMSDFANNRTLGYYMTLPIPSWLALSRLIVYFSLNAAIMSLLGLVVGSAFLWSSISLITVSPFKLFLIMFTSSFFYGAYAFAIASFVTKFEELGNVWMRFVFPLWFLGGFQFSLQALTDVSPIFGAISLINPLIYVMEGTRGALLGHEQFLNFWVCLGAVFSFAMLFSVVGIKRWQKRLDCVK